MSINNLELQPSSLDQLLEVVEEEEGDEPMIEEETTMMMPREVDNDMQDFKSFLLGPDKNMTARCAEQTVKWVSFIKCIIRIKEKYKMQK